MTERTPPRGNLTRALAKRMRDERAAARIATPSAPMPAVEPGVEPRHEDDTVPRVELPKLPAPARVPPPVRMPASRAPAPVPVSRAPSPVPAPRAPPPVRAARPSAPRTPAPAPAPRAPNELEQRWDDDTPAPMWISASQAPPSWSIAVQSTSASAPEVVVPAPALAPAPVPVPLPVAAPAPAFVLPTVPVPVDVPLAPPPPALDPSWSEVELAPGLVIDDASTRPASGLARKLAIALGAGALIALAVRAFWPGARPVEHATREPAHAFAPSEPATAVVAPEPAKVAVAPPALPSPALPAPPNPAQPASERADEGDESSHERSERSARERAEGEADEPSPSAAEPVAPVDAPSQARAPTAAEVAASEVLRLTPKPGSAAAPASAAKTVAPPAAVAAPAAPAARATRGPSREAVVIEQVIPKFPARARRLEVTEGAVDIAYTVDSTGAVRDAVVESAQPAGVFDDAALGAIQRWRFSPKLQDGKPVPSRKRFKFTFR